MIPKWFPIPKKNILGIKWFPIPIPIPKKMIFYDSHNSQFRKWIRVAELCSFCTKPTTIYSIFKKKTQVQKIESLPSPVIEEMNSTDQSDEELNDSLKEADYQKWLKITQQQYGAWPKNRFARGFALAN